MFFIFNTKGSGLTGGHFRLPSSLSNLKVIRAYMKYFHLSRGREKFLSWGRKISIFIDDIKVQKIIETTKHFTNYFFMNNVTIFLILQSRVFYTIIKYIWFFVRFALPLQSKRDDEKDFVLARLLCQWSMCAGCGIEGGF